MLERLLRKLWKRRKPTMHEIIITLDIVCFLLIIVVTKMLKVCILYGKTSHSFKVWICCQITHHAFVDDQVALLLFKLRRPGKKKLTAARNHHCQPRPPSSSLSPASSSSSLSSSTGALSIIIIKKIHWAPLTWERTSCRGGFPLLHWPHLHNL